MRRVALVGHATIHRAIAGRRNDELCAADVAVRVRALLDDAAARCDSASARTSAPISVATMRTCAPAASSARALRAATAPPPTMSASIAFAVQHQRQLAHRNSPERGPTARKATYSVITATKNALDQIAARAACHPATTRPTVSAVIAIHAVTPQMTFS